MEVVVTTGLVQSSSQIITTNKQTPSFYRPDALPVAQPTVSKQWREQYHIPWTCLPQTHLEVFQLRLWPLIAPGFYLGGVLSCLSSALGLLSRNVASLSPTWNRNCVQNVETVTVTLWVISWWRMMSLNVRLTDRHCRERSVRRSRNVRTGSKGRRPEWRTTDDTGCRQVLQRARMSATRYHHTSRRSARGIFPPSCYFNGRWFRLRFDFDSTAVRLLLKGH